MEGVKQLNALQPPGLEAGVYTHGYATASRGTATITPRGKHANSREISECDSRNDSPVSGTERTSSDGDARSTSNDENSSIEISENSDEIPKKKALKPEKAGQSHS